MSVLILISCDFSPDPPGWVYCCFFPLSFEVEIVWLPALFPH